MRDTANCGAEDAIVVPASEAANAADGIAGAISALLSAGLGEQAEWLADKTRAFIMKVRTPA